MKKELNTLFSIPYKIGGLKKISIRNSLISNNNFENNASLEEGRSNENSLLPIFVFPSKISKSTSDYVNILYNKCIYNMFDPDTLLINTKINNQENTSMDNLSIYNKSFLNTLNKNNKIETYRKLISENYQIYNYTKNLKNDIIFDKIFIHLNYQSENIFDKNSQKIKSMNHNPSKKLYVFNYKDSNSSISEKFIVRLSFWIKASNPIIINKNNSEETKYKIFNDEYHHMLLEFEDNLNNLNFINFFSRYSFVNFAKNIILGNNKKTNINENLSNLKICDFDFYVEENNIQNSIKNLDKNGYNEYFYIKYL